MEKRIKLYKGKVTILFDEEKHKFTHLDGKSIDSVTSATGKIDKSAPLMGWAIKMMGIYINENYDPEKIKTKEDMGLLVDIAKREYRRIKEEAADIGTEIHEWASDWIKGKKVAIPEEERARNGVIGFMKWIKDQEKIKITESEKFIYSQKYDFAGIMDWEGKDDGELVIGDFKSSKGIYPEMEMQLSGYWLAREEETGKKYAKGYIVQFGKENGEFKTLEIQRKEHLKNAKAFLAALTIKRRLDEMK